MASDDRGLALVEFTIILPFLIILLAGLFEFGRLIQHRHAIVKGVGDAARYLAHVAPSSLDCAGGVGSVSADERTRAQNLVVYGSTTTAGRKIVSYLMPDDVSIAVDCVDNSDGSYRGREEMAVIRVEAETEYPDLGWLDVLGLGPITFSVSHQQLHIGE